MTSTSSSVDQIGFGHDLGRLKQFAFFFLSDGGDRPDRQSPRETPGQSGRHDRSPSCTFASNGKYLILARPCVVPFDDAFVAGPLDQCRRWHYWDRSIAGQRRKTVCLHHPSDHAGRRHDTHLLTHAVTFPFIQNETAVPVTWNRAR